MRNQSRDKIRSSGILQKESWVRLLRNAEGEKNTYYLAKYMLNIVKSKGQDISVTIIPRSRGE